jgi:LPXTG-motif cell wall-anchored protein
LHRLLRTAIAFTAVPLAAAVCLGVSATPAGAVSAAPSTTTDPAPAAAGWLARQLTDGNHLESCFGAQCFPDYGLTADAVLGMASAKSSGTSIAAAATWLAANAAAYIGASDGTGPYAGSYAKLALVAEATGNDPAAFGGVDLLAQLRAQQCPHAGCVAGEEGAFKNTLPEGGFANDVTQSLAILALSRSTRPADTAAIAAAAAFLTRQQCAPASGFPTFFRTTGTCTPDVDATAFAIQALLAGGLQPTGAVNWLAAQRQPSGGFVGNGAVNANSTGVAVQALSAAGRDTTAAQAFMATLQMGCRAPTADRGAISYNGVATFKTATAVRATAQGIFGFTKAPLADLTTAGVAPATLTLACAATLPPGPVPTPSVIGRRVATGAQLAATGTDVRPFLAAGGVFILLGLGLLVLARRRRTP